MPELDELYQSIILDHNKRPRHYGALPDATHQADGYNPTCGDKVTVYLKVSAGCIEAIQFEAASCAICKASASMMMQALVGKSLPELADLEGQVELLLSEDVPNTEPFGELVALQGVRNFPARINCASLPWKTLRDALKAKESS